MARCAAAWQRDRSHCVAEAERARAIASPNRRAQFLAGRWLAASLLAARHGNAVRDWQFSCEPGHAPRVLAGAASPWLSIAHRGDVLACAVADQSIGVDVELEGHARATADERAELVLAAEELAEFTALPPAEREPFVLARWALKEAWAKRSGRGLGLGEMTLLVAREAAAGGNARLWRASGLLLALCADGAHAVWPQPQGEPGLDGAAAEAWQIEPAAR